MRCFFNHLPGIYGFIVVHHTNSAIFWIFIGHSFQPSDYDGADIMLIGSSDIKANFAIAGTGTMPLAH